MKKILAILLVLAVSLIPAAVAESWIGEAVDAGRGLSTVISLSGIEALADYKLASYKQKTNGSYGEFCLYKGEDELLSGFSGTTEDGSVAYFQASPLGDMVFAFADGDVQVLGQQIANLLQQTGLISEEEMTKVNSFLEGFKTGSISSQIDFANLDFTPLLTAVMGMEDCVTIVEPEVQGQGMEIIVRVTPDDAKTLLDAIEETIWSSPDVEALLQAYAGSIEESKAQILEKLAGDLVIDILTDAIGVPSDISVTLAVVAGDAVRTYAYDFAMDSGMENGLAVALTGRYSDSGETVAHNLFEISYAAAAEGQVVTFSAGEVDADNIVVTVTIPNAQETETTKQTDIYSDIMGVSGGVKFDYTFDISAYEEKVGGDALRTIVLMLSDANAQTEIASLTVDQVTGEAEGGISLTDAVYPAQMDADTLTGLGMELVLNVLDWLEDVSPILGLDQQLGALLGA